MTDGSDTLASSSRTEGSIRLRTARPSDRRSAQGTPTPAARSGWTVTPASTPRPLPDAPATFWLWILAAPPTDHAPPIARPKPTAISDSDDVRSEERSVLRSSRSSIPPTPKER
jgi:hypothetical protein